MKLRCGPDPGPVWRHVAWWLALIALAVVGVVAMVSAATTPAGRIAAQAHRDRVCG